MSRPFEIMGCDEVDRRLEAYLDDDLDADEAAAVADHLRRCARCADEHRLAVDLLAELRSLPRPDAPESVLAGAIDAIDRQPRVGKGAGGERAWRLLAAAAVVCAVSAGVWWQWGPGPARPSDAEIATATREAKLALALVSAVSSDAAGDGVLYRRVLSPALRGISRRLGNTFKLSTAPQEQGPKSKATKENKL